MFNKRRKSLVLFKRKTWSVVACIFIALMFHTTVGVAETNKRPSVKHAPILAQKAVISALSDSPRILREIARCESGFRQFDANGAPLKNIKSSATGVFQIMYSAHYRAAKNHGWDLLTTKGNIAYAKHLYNTEGTSPWKSSKDCWS